MRPLGWFLFMVGAGAVVGLALLFEERLAGGTITVGEPWGGDP